MIIIKPPKSNGFGYGFTVKGYPKDQWGWLYSVFTANMELAYNQGRADGIKEIQDPIKKALSFLDK